MATELEALAKRVSLLEEVVNSVQIALTNVASVDAVNEIILLKQRDIASLQTSITALEAQVALIKAEVFR
jgi:hypothetical protein